MKNKTTKIKFEVGDIVYLTRPMNFTFSISHLGITGIGIYDYRNQEKQRGSYYLTPKHKGIIKNIKKGQVYVEFENIFRFEFDENINKSIPFCRWIEKNFLKKENNV